MKVLSAALLGALFGVGLLLSGMTDPARVRGFLDIAGRWDPSLAFVMGGALLVSLPAFTLIRRRKTAILGGPIVDPKGRVLDPALLAGSALFGIGWGLVGICPGPSLVILGLAPARIMIFLAAMAIGVLIARGLTHRQAIAAEGAWQA